MNPSELSDGEQAHYYHTLQYFNELVRVHGPKQVLEDLKNLDLTTYDSLLQWIASGETKRRAAVLLMKDPYFDSDGRC
jgi:hypothetical protein